MVSFWLVNSDFSSAAAPAVPWAPTAVCWLTSGRDQVCAGIGRAPRKFTIGRAASMKLMTGCTMGSGSKPGTSLVLSCDAAR